MVTGQTLKKQREEITAMKDRDRREREHLKLLEEKKKLQMAQKQRNVTWFEKGLRNIKKDVTSPSSKRKITKFGKLIKKELDL